MGEKRRSRAAIDKAVDEMVKRVTREGPLSLDDLGCDTVAASVAVQDGLLVEADDVYDLGPKAKPRDQVVYDWLENEEDERDADQIADGVEMDDELCNAALRQLLRDCRITETRELHYVAIPDDNPPISTPSGRIISSGTRFLDHVLTPAEILELREKREAIDLRIESVSRDLDEAKAHAKSLANCIEALTDEGRECSRLVRAKSRRQNVTCEEREEGLYAVTYRLDTGEEIERRELRTDERQGDLFADEAEAAE